MTRVLVIQTASAKRLKRSVESILAGRVYPQPEITVLCEPNSELLEHFSAFPQIQVIPLGSKDRFALGRKVRRKSFDIVRIFWTGEKKYRSLKLAAVWLWPYPTDVESGDGGVFRLTWKAVPRHLIFRWKHPLPTDHWELVPRLEPLHYPGERVLIIQSAEPPVIFRALEHLKSNHLFHNPGYWIFCRNKPEDLRQFRAHPMISRVLSHTETAGSWEHLVALRRERFEVLVLFFTGDPSYWKIKYFAFLLGVRHKLIFNEHNDCFFFSLRAWLRFLSDRLTERTSHFDAYPTSQLFRSSPLWFQKLRFLMFLLIKFVTFPFRFVWLLFVWLRLRLESDL